MACIINYYNFSVETMALKAKSKHCQWLTTKINHTTITIKTHGSVSCGPRNQENLGVRQTSVYFTGVKKMPFSCICSLKLPEQKQTKFSVQISSGWGTSNSKFELNPLSRSQDMHNNVVKTVIIKTYGIKQKFCRSVERELSNKMSICITIGMDNNYLGVEVWVWGWCCYTDWLIVYCNAG